MINLVYQLIEPRAFSIKFEDIDVAGKVLVRPRCMAICHADQRYYQGRRDPAVLKRKLPMALIHECCGEVLADPTGTFKPGDRVALIPNVPPKGDLGEFYENYVKGARFLSSGHDGFMREIVAIEPRQLVPFSKVPFEVAAITEFISVAVHAVTRMTKVAHSTRDSFGVWGDGSLGYVVCAVLREFFPKARICVFGHHPEKMALFSFVDEAYDSDQIPADLRVDHAFECTGGNGCASALDSIVTHCNPQATVMLMGVSETPVPIRTRDVMERGMTLIGCSRSGREDFQQAIAFLEHRVFQQRIRRIIHVDAPVRSIGDIIRVFATDTRTPFKTVFKWEM